MDQDSIGVAYYKAMGKKDKDSMATWLHEGVKLRTPLADVEGKEAVLSAASQFFNYFHQLTIRTFFQSGNQEMVVYDVECPTPIGMIRAAALLTIVKGLITHVELFFDPRAFVAKKTEIFSS